MSHDASGAEPGLATTPLSGEGEDDRISDIKWVDAPVIIVFWVLAFVVFLQFFTRYVLNNSLGWTEEIARYLLIAVTFIGAITAVRRQSHIAVELLYRWLPRRARVAMQIAVDLVSLGFYGWMTWLCTQMAQRTFQKMVSIDVPKSALYWMVAVCFAGMTIYAVFVLARHLATRTSRLIDPEAFAPGPDI